MSSPLGKAHADQADRTSFSLAIFPRYKVNFPADINLVTASGARVAGLPERYLPIISEFGNCLGQCYQIADDLLDVSSTFRGSKEPFMDIQESKSTIGLIHLLNHACAYDKQKVIEILHKVAPHQDQSRGGFSRQLDG